MCLRPAPLHPVPNFLRVAQWLARVPFAKTRQSAFARLMAVPIGPLGDSPAVSKQQENP